jgi:MoaA/NifB/PqqE/SkfB family radical SAM enzyme
MKLVRGVANTMIRRGLPHLEDASPETIRSAFQYLRWLAVRCGVPLPKEVDDRFLRNAVGIIGRAAIDTPYGHPLQFECPLIITLAVSDYCPFACTNCYSNSGRTSTSENAADGVHLIFEKVANSTTPFVLITGGEPLASQSTRPGVQALLDAGKWVQISTNASIASYIDIAERYPTTLNFVLPIWGRRERHNEIRGHQSFERVERNLGLLNKCGLRGQLLIVLADDDLGVFEDVSRLVQKFAVSLTRVIRKVKVGRRDEMGPEMSPRFAYALKRQARRLRRYLPFVLVDIPELRSRRRGTLMQSVVGIPRYESCAAGNWMMHIDSSGAAFPCYTFEASGRSRVSSALSIFDQWRRVQLDRRDLGNGDICVGEAQSA